MCAMIWLVGPEKRGRLHHSPCLPAKPARGTKGTRHYTILHTLSGAPACHTAQGPLATPATPTTSHTLVSKGPLN